MDNAKIYRSPQLARMAASIGVLIVHTPPFQPEGCGKIERFFRTVREQFQDFIEPTALHLLEQLNERFWHWLENILFGRDQAHAAIQHARHNPGIRPEPKAGVSRSVPGCFEKPEECPLDRVPTIAAGRLHFTIPLSAAQSAPEQHA
ncbi:MAG: hypothetical protein JNK87_17325 [Bryobacterales bacterium]|nr:hypothetical protein [Bryobacterales bacterium]